jgi:ParB family chromosome partitioning protein
VGLLHPIVLSPEKKLIVGERRLRACKSLGWEKIPARIVSTLADLETALRAEADENTCRKNFTPLEAVAVGEHVEKVYKPEAESREKSGKSADGKAGGRGTTNPGKSLPRDSRDESARTTAVAAAAVEMSRPTYEKPRPFGMLRKTIPTSSAR